MKFPFYKQLDQKDCAPSCLRMIAKYYGQDFKPSALREYANISRDGVSLLGLAMAAEKIGFQASAGKIEFPRIKDMELPCILHWRRNHFVILYKIDRKKYYVADPSIGLIKLSEEEFREGWTDGNIYGFLMLLIPTENFSNQKQSIEKSVQWSVLFKYVVTHKKLFIYLLISLVIGSILQLVAPFFTQAIIDIGINTHDINLINLILIAQLMLIVGRISVDFFRSWILLHISTRINISIVTDFLIKLMKLPISFFDTRMTGDVLQRINDQREIEKFLTGSTLNTIFSLFNIFVFAFVLAHYNLLIVFIFLLSSILYTTWIFLFLKRRRNLNYKLFAASAKNQSAIVHLLDGMQEIKLNNCENQKRWQWESIQAKLFKLNIRDLLVSQYQQGGAIFINEGANLLITFISAKAVIAGNLSLGGMMAVQYIVGQLNAPMQQFLSFIQGYQTAKISMERLNEIYEMQDEERMDVDLIRTLPSNQSIIIQNITFQYPGSGNTPVLKDISFDIEQGKTTAIVGMSGSGKTTILKLLLRFYNPEQGEILIDDEKLMNISHEIWRIKCGIVMQEGYIFSDTIEQNIAVGVDFPDQKRLEKAIKIANITDLIDKLPLGVKTVIGAEGNGISQGQKQRILSARAVYKDPQYILFDEATNSLDANNEKMIMENLNDFFVGRTVIIVAHRLSTVRHADNIIVLDKGRLVEQGDHDKLCALNGYYYQLVKNQLELGR
jgi:ATP-binding cassette subfamily B protein